MGVIVGTLLRKLIWQERSCIFQKLTRKSKKEISEIKNLIKDKNYRIFLSDKGINILNSEIQIEGIDPFEFYTSLNVEKDASHSFYLGVELARAQIAFQL